MKKAVFGLCVAASFGANAQAFDMTYNTENPFYMPRQNEFYSKTQVEASFTKLSLKGASDINGNSVPSNRDIKSNDIFINERIGYGITRQFELFAEGGWVISNLKWEDNNTGDSLKADDNDLNYINAGASFFLTRTANFSAKVSASYAFAPDNDIVGYGDKVHLNAVIGKEYRNLILALHGGVTFNLKDDATIDYYGLQEKMNIDSSIDYMVAGEIMYGFNRCLSGQLMLRYEIFNPKSEQNLNFLNHETAKIFGTDKNDNVFTVAGQLNYSITKSILAAVYVGMSWHSLDKYSTVDPFDAVGYLPVGDISELAPAFRNYEIDDFYTTYAGLKFNIVF
ncbi:MAG: hypothetical protein LBR35_02425 [Rickettsiales bacterium]|jgi:hypothetical protein|nr:hypothetical protein [Rickettsiales bacterium]